MNLRATQYRDTKNDPTRTAYQDRDTGEMYEADKKTRIKPPKKATKDKE